MAETEDPQLAAALAEFRRFAAQQIADFKAFSQALRADAAWEWWTAFVARGRQDGGDYSRLCLKAFDAGGPYFEMHGE